MKLVESFICLVICLLFVHCEGEQIKSNLGGRHSQYVSKNQSLINPYITDGLIAMWDGEWNAGLGIHDEAPAIWLDCISGQALIFGTDVGVIGNSFENLTKDDTSKNTPAVLTMENSELTYHLMSIGYFTIEICEDATSVQSYYVWNSPLIRLTNKDSISTSYGSAIFIQQYYNRFLSYGIFGNASFYQAFDLHSFSFCVNNSELESLVYKNGARARVGSIPQITAFTAIPLKVGITNKMYCIRIYDRVLSANEVHHNYLIDKRRFDLP